MTKEEAIKELENIRDNFNYALTPNEVFEMAIKSLNFAQFVANEIFADDFEKGNCMDCPFHYDEWDEWNIEFHTRCVFMHRYDECDLEVIKE